MTRYLLEVHCTLDGVRRLKADGGTAMVDATRVAVEALGGTVVAHHFALGAVDAFVVAELPESVAAAEAEAAVCGDGWATAHSVVVLTPDEADAAGPGIISSFL